jgi:hypothetical protein
MDLFYTNFKGLTDGQRRAKLDQITNFLRQHNSHAEANAFQELKNCYPQLPLPPNERAFREYLAWSEVSAHQDHRIVGTILSQG